MEGNMENWNTRKLISVAWHSRDEKQGFSALLVLLKRFKELKQSGGLNACAYTKTLTIKDFLKVFRNKNNRSDHSMNLLETLHKEALLSVKDYSYVIIYSGSENIAIRAFEMLICSPLCTVDDIRYICKEIAQAKKILKSLVQDFLITHKDVAEDDFRYVAEFGVTKGIAIKSVALLIAHPKRTDASLGRVYRASAHASVKRMVRHLVR